MPRNLYYGMFINWRNSSEILDNIPSRYRHLKKLFTYPYTVIEATTYTGTPIVIKPELWNDPDAIMIERATLIPPGQRIEFSPMLYNTKLNDPDQMDLLWPLPNTDDALDGYEGQVSDSEGDTWDFVTQIANFPTMSIVNNGAISYLASNTHGIAFQHSSADWTQQRALGMAQGQYDIATGAIQTMRDLSAIGQISVGGQAAIQNMSAAQQAQREMIMSPTAGAASGSVFGARGGAAGAAAGLAQGINAGWQANIQMGITDAAANMQQNTMKADTAINAQQGTLMRDTNKNLADWAAKGDYANQVAGINAKVQDAQLIQPTTSGQMGGETINIVNGGFQLSLRFKMIDQATIKRIGDYWLRYGYAIRAAIKPPASLQVMTKFTYWKMIETYISSSTVPEGMKQGIRGILEKGTTVWSNPNDIGNIDWADNAPLPGVSY